MKSIVRFTSVLALAFAGEVSAAPARLERVDPLTRPAPPAAERLLLPKDVQTPESKIVPRLWAQLASAGTHEEIPVIVELQQPVLRIAAPAYSAEWDEQQAAATAAVEHRFAAAAAGWISQLRGLSHVPLVFGTATREGIERLSALPEVFRVYPDGAVHALRTEGGALIKANTLRTSFGGTGNGVGVAVLDTGIDATHPELASRVVAQADTTGTTGDGTKDGDGHGTNSAGIIAGTGGGMAPQAALWAIKVLDDEGSGSDSGILEGLDVIYASRNQFGGLDLVNMSLGARGPHNSDCDGTSPYHSIFGKLVGAGIAVFVSSGNNADGNGISSPACHSKVIAVGAVYDADIGGAAFDNCNDATTGADRITCYSDSGNPLDILAPSHCAITPKPGGGFDNCFGGTSAAAPYAAGVAAQLLSLRPNTTPAALRTALMTTGKPLTDVNAITRNRIDAVAAFQALGGGGGGGGNTGPCSRDADTSCLLANRFEVDVDWQTTGDSGKAQVMSFGGQRAENSESTFYWFFTPTNFEMGLKILDACSINNRFWIFISGLTNQGWTVRIRDTQTGATKTYSNPTGKTTQTTADTSALPCP